MSSGEEICRINRKSNSSSKNITGGKSASEVVKSEFSHLIVLVEFLVTQKAQALSGLHVGC